MEGSRVTLRTPHGEMRLELPLPGLYNVYNALAAVPAAIELGVAPERIAAALAAMRAAFGRVETVEIDGRRLSILLIKNPAGANEVLRTLLLEAGGEGLDLWIALNDRIAEAATSPGSGMPTSSCWREPCVASSAPARGRPRWRCG